MFLKYCLSSILRPSSICARGEHITLFPKKNLGKVFYFSEIREKFPDFEFARYLSRIAKYAFFLVITITISGKRKIFILICLQYLMGDGGEIIPCWRGKVSLLKGEFFPV